MLSSTALADAPLDRLKPLAGHWKATTASGKTLTIDYRFLSADTVLLEAYNAGTPKETMTVFHADKADLLATHYCAQGNQPRLKLQPGKGLIFTFLDATNLPDPEASHLIRLEFRLEADGSLTRIETYREKGKDDVATLQLRK